ncbi:hypothetical protein JTB14_026504 [Gonioctena quinquepunctata]|nr:hypothetical protein JTB14_026504 [Gonioctena quinquepunctata]
MKLSQKGVHYWSSQSKEKKNNPSPEPKKRNEFKDRGEILETTIERMIDQIEKLNRVVKEMYKPKQEVKEVASRLALHAEQLKNKELMRWLGEVDKENRVSESEQGWRNEKECLRQHIQAMEEAHRNDLRNQSGLQLAPNAKNAGRSRRKKKEGRDTAPELWNLPDDNRSRLGKMKYFSK